MEELFKEFSEDPKQLPSLSLAYIGDGVFELYVRMRLLTPEAKNTKMHVKAIHYVKASAQAGYFKKIEPILTPEEEAVAKRGRNAKSRTSKTAGIVEYHMSTGFEALVGYLYLKKEYERLSYLLDYALSEDQNEQL